MKIYILTMNRYPEPSALGTRITLVAKILAEGGHAVTVFGRGEEAEGNFDGIQFRSLRGKAKNRLAILFDVLFLFKSRLFKVLKNEKPDAVVFYSLPPGVNAPLIKMYKKGDFLLLNECLEWYSKEEFHPFKPEIVHYYIREHLMKKRLPGVIPIVTISKYLQRYFQEKGNPTVYLPSVCDTSAAFTRKEPASDRVIIAYAGSPVKKDLFEPIVKAIAELSEEQRKRFQLHIVGSTAATIATNANVSEAFIASLSDCIRFIPRMPHSEVLKYLEKVDFTILIRPAEMRYAKAGFPTKVPESLSTGTPVICNFSSDLSSFLRDGVDSIIAVDDSTESVKNAFERTIALSFEQRCEMFRNARKTAEERFDYRLYIQPINHFVKTEYEKLRKT